MPLGRRHLCSQILIQAAARRDVEQLDAPTHAEDRQIRGERPLRQRQLGGIARRVDVAQRRMPRFAEVRGIHIDPAGQTQPVQPGEQVGQRVFGQTQWNDHWQRARGRQRRGVVAVELVVGCAGGGWPFVDGSRYPDHRTSVCRNHRRYSQSGRTVHRCTGHAIAGPLS